MAYQLSPIELQQENHRLQVELTELRSRYESLQRSEARYRQAFENAPISMVFISTEGEPIEMNSAAEEFLGWTIADAPKAPEANFNGRTDPTIVKNGKTASLDRAIAGETVIEPPMYFNPNSTIGRGQWKWAQGHYYPIRDAAGQVQEVIEIALDLTATHEMQQKLAQERTRLLQATAQVSNLLLRASDYKAVLPNVVRLLGEAAKSDRCGVMQNIDLHPILHQPAAKILIKWCKSNLPTLLELTPHFEQAFLWDDVPEAYETLARGQVFNRLVENIPEPGQSLLKAQGNNSCLFVPILVEGKLWGLLNFDNCGEPRLNNEAEIAMLQVAAESLSAAIARQAKDEELRESEHRYRNLFEISSEGIYRFEFEQPIPINLPVEEQVELVYRHCRLAEANATYAAMYNEDSPETLIGLRLSDVHVMESEQNRAIVRAVVKSGYQLRNAETKEVDLEGNPRYFLNNITTIIRNGCALGGWASQLDITELRLAQQALLKTFNIEH